MSINYNILKNINKKSESKLVLPFKDSDGNVLDVINIELTPIQLLTVIRALGINEFAKVTDKIVDVVRYTDEDLIKINNILFNSSDVFDVSKDLDIKAVHEELLYPEENFESL